MSKPKPVSAARARAHGVSAAYWTDDFDEAYETFIKHWISREPTPEEKEAFIDGYNNPKRQNVSPHLPPDPGGGGRLPPLRKVNASKGYAVTWTADAKFPGDVGPYSSLALAKQAIVAHVKCAPGRLLRFNDIGKGQHEVMCGDTVLAYVLSRSSNPLTGPAVGPEGRGHLHEYESNPKKSRLTRHIEEIVAESAFMQEARQNVTHECNPGKGDVRSYIRRIKNVNKRAYAEAYLAWIQSGATGSEPERGDLSFMAAQAVRHNLIEMTGIEPYGENPTTGPAVGPEGRAHLHDYESNPKKSRLTRHIEEIVAESGREMPSPSRKSKVRYKGHDIKVWYDEGQSVYYPWNAFVMGLGSRSGESREEVIAKMKKLLDEGGAEKATAWKADPQNIPLSRRNPLTGPAVGPEGRGHLHEYESNPRKSSPKESWYKDAVKFFMKHAGSSYDPKTETKAQGKRRGAEALARAEEYAQDQGWTVEWEDEVDDPAGHFDDPRDVEAIRDGSVEWLAAVLRDEEGNVLGSLGGISIHVNDRNYGRVVEAELALEAMPSEPVRSNPFMVPEYAKGTAWSVETSHGGYIVLSDLVSTDGYKVDEIIEASENPELAESLSQYVEGEVEEMSVVKGWFAHLTAHGYMDQTEWAGPFKTQKEAEKYIEDTYEVDPETGEELE